MANAEDMIVQHDTSLYREVREFERYIMVRHSQDSQNRGLLEDVRYPVRNKYAIWGRIRPMKMYEQEKVAGKFKDGTLIFEFKMPLRSHVPNVGDYLYVAVLSRQPRTKYLVSQILSQLSLTIGRCVITPIGKESVGAESSA